MSRSALVTPQSINADSTRSLRTNPATRAHGQHECDSDSGHEDAWYSAVQAVFSIFSNLIVSLASRPLTLPDSLHSLRLLPI